MPIEDRKVGETAKEQSLRILVAHKLLELMTAAFSLVAALAWNDAIQALFQKIFGPQSNILAKFIYAVFVTALVVWVGFRLSRLTKLIDKKTP